MASHEYPEQDLQGGDDLPTYDDLTETHGANSRFGRWRSWIEKRAAERYTDITQEERERRRQRGWDLNEHAEADLGAQLPVPQVRVEEPSVSVASGSTSTPSRLSVQTLLKSLPEPPPLDEPEDNLSLESRLLISESLEPTHLCVKHFGSRFLAHTTSQIHTLLPILGDRLLLIGHDEGLSVMNMFPQDWGDDGLITQGPSEAQVHTIWRGEGVFQMTILEVESVGDGIPQGVLLALVGSEAEGTRDEPLRVLRMYNLSSLISLAKWTIANKGAHPLQLGRTAEWQSQDSGSKRRKRASGHLAKGIKNFMAEAATQLQPELSTFPIRGRSPSSESRPSMGRTDTESSWDIVEDLPLRWATDHVPLATSGSRLSNLSVVTFALWKDGRQGRGSALLAVATKSSILLYESKGERAFRFVKDFYTPVTPRSLAFVHQAVQDTMSRSPSEASTIKHTRQSSNHIASQRHVSMNPRPVQYGQQLSLFIVFEKKAGIIRLADSAVAEVEMYNDSIGETSSLPDTSSVSSLTSPTRHSRRGRGSGDGFAMLRDHKGPWIVPAAAEVPFMSDGEFKQAIYCLTRGKKTHIVPNPFPADIAHTPPLKVLKWRTSPTSVACRVLNPDDRGRQPHLQVIASSEDGVEVLELPTATLLDRKEKGRAEEPLRSQTNFGGHTGLLCPGGHWDRPYDAPLAPLSRSYSTSSAMSYSSMDTDELVARLEMEQGLYGWQQRGLEDWRIFWAGGTGHDEVIG